MKAIIKNTRYTYSYISSQKQISFGVQMSIYSPAENRSINYNVFFGITIYLPFLFLHFAFRTRKKLNNNRK